MPVGTFVMQFCWRVKKYPPSFQQKMANPAKLIKHKNLIKYIEKLGPSHGCSATWTSRWVLRTA
jgi:hypothetical protein